MLVIRISKFRTRNVGSSLGTALREVKFQKNHSRKRKFLNSHCNNFKRFEEAAARGDGFKLVFTDVIMPGGANGITLANQIRERAPDVPVLLTTGYNDEMSIKGPQIHAMDVLGKPYRRSEMIDRVQSSLRRGARTGPARQTSDFGHAKA
ncbi:response regulator [Methylobacterium sp. CM6241]